MRTADALEKYEEYMSVKVKSVTVRRTRSDLWQFCVYIRDAEMDTITPDDIIDYLRICKKMGVKQNTIYARAVALRGFFDFCYRRSWTKVFKDAIPIPPREYVKPRTASEEEYKGILKAIEKCIKRGKQRIVHIRNEAIIRMLWDTGMRAGECMSLNIDDPTIWEGGGTAQINTEKSRGQVPFRQVYWSQNTQTKLQRWLEERERYSKKYNFYEPDALFVTSSQGMYGKRMEPSALSILLRKYSKMADIKTLNAHSFRHRKGRYIIEQGGSGADVMNILGHARLESSNPYVRLYGKDVEERAKRFLD